MGINMIIFHYVHIKFSRENKVKTFSKKWWIVTLSWISVHHNDNSNSTMTHCARTVWFVLWLSPHSDTTVFHYVMSILSCDNTILNCGITKLKCEITPPACAISVLSGDIVMLVHAPQCCGRASWCPTVPNPLVTNFILCVYSSW